jgi:hypothetical protein
MTAITATQNTSLFGTSVPLSQMADSSASGLTGTVAFRTPGGTVTVQYGGTNNYNASGTKLGLTGVTNGDFSITNSTDSALTTSGGGSFEDYANVVRLAYATFGVWSLNPCSNNANCLPTYVGSYAGGQPGQSPTTAMPTTGSATYSGGAVGYIVATTGPNNAGQFYGTSNLTANFATGGITGSISGINAYSVQNNGSGATPLGTVNTIGLAATISGSNFTGTTNVTGGAGTAFDISGATGSLSGSFFGPSAQEVAGVFDLSGTTTQVIGSLGATSTPTPRALTTRFLSETATVSQSSAGYSATVDTSLHGALIGYSVSGSATSLPYTGTATFSTPGSGSGTVTAVSDLTTQNSGTKTGVAGVLSDHFSISASADPALVAGTAVADVKQYGAATGLQYTDYGNWGISPNNTGSALYVGTYAGGAPGVGQTASMPTTGSATFVGGAQGFVVPASTAGTAGNWYGNSNIVANFATGSVTGSITGIQAYSVNNGGSGQTLLGTINNIGFTASINGSNYAGVAGSVTANGPAGTAFDITGGAGAVKGAFYGPTANETAGVFYMTGGGANNLNVVGSFGAKQAAPSDRRLKQDITPVATLPNGLKLYSWRYLGGHHRFTGVMAQDLLASRHFAGAVLVDGDGLMRVDYARIGYAPHEIAAMVAEGEAAMALYRATLH